MAEYVFLQFDQLIQADLGPLNTDTDFVDSPGGLGPLARHRHHSGCHAPSTDPARRIASLTE